LTVTDPLKLLPGLSKFYRRGEYHWAVEECSRFKVSLEGPKKGLLHLDRVRSGDCDFWSGKLRQWCRNRGRKWKVHP